MANEITLSFSLAVLKGELTMSKNLAGSIDMAGTRPLHTVQSIDNAAHEKVTVPADVGTKGLAIFKNLDATNFVQVGRDSGGSFVAHAKLLPGEWCVGRLASGDVYAKSDTAACDLEVIVLPE